jgi:RimJ/RimL family protein N-acetyltransferase
VVSLLAVNAAEATAEVGYWVAVPFWGRGIATAAVKEVIRYAFVDLTLSRLYADCLAKNLSSARVLQKCGFLEIGQFTIEAPPRFKGELARRFSLGSLDWKAQTAHEHDGNGRPEPTRF